MPNEMYRVTVLSGAWSGRCICTFEVSASFKDEATYKALKLAGSNPKLISTSRVSDGAVLVSAH